MTSERLEFGQRLRVARKAAGLKQEQVANHLGLPISAVSCMETGQRKVDAYELFVLSQLYQRSMEWFFNEECEEDPGPRQRWYDLDPLLRESIGMLQRAPRDLQKNAAQGLMGFLGER